MVLFFACFFLCPWVGYPTPTYRELHEDATPPGLIFRSSELDIISPQQKMGSCRKGRRAFGGKDLAGSFPKMYRSVLVTPVCYLSCVAKYYSEYIIVTFGITALSSKRTLYIAVLLCCCVHCFGSLPNRNPALSCRKPWCCQFYLCDVLG